ncbi:MAG: 50S ribosomal protein L18 [Nitrososphaerales archaeon]
MPKNSYVQIPRRRRDGKTDYRKRKGLIVGRKPMFAIRVSNKFVYGQILEATPKGDLTLCSASSRELREAYGWKGSCKNLPAAYLAGYLLGCKALTKQISEAILYTGVNRFVHGSRIASAIKGAKDAGLELAVAEEALPKDERMRGGHVAAYAKTLAETDNKDYSKIFSGTIASGFNPREYSSHFEKIKTAISPADTKSAAKS